jgi:hypothetical protein
MKRMYLTLLIEVRILLDGFGTNFKLVVRLLSEEARLVAICPLVSS